MQVAAEKGKPEKVTEMDVWAVVLRAGVENTPDQQDADMRLAAWALKHESWAMHQYLFKNRLKLNSLIDDIWRWERVHDIVAQSQRTPMEILHHQRGDAHARAEDRPTAAPTSTQQRKRTNFQFSLPSTSYAADPEGRTNG